MTRDRDIERVLDRFYAEGPSEMPDRLLLGVVDRIEHVPQRRLAFKTRFATMNATLRLATAAAIVVAVVGVGTYALSQRPSVGPQSTPTPSPAAASSGTGSIPVALRSRWVGASRVVPQAPEPPYRIGMQIDTSEVMFLLSGSGARTEFRSRESSVGSDVIALQLESDEAGCHSGDQGTYRFATSTDGTALSLTPIADACAGRSAALAGDWVRAACPDPAPWCLGDLTPGAHASIVFTPRVAPASWAFDYGALSYSVPAGWTNGDDSAATYGLAKKGGPANTGIFVWSDVLPHLQAQQCSQAPEPGVGHTADAIATWLTTLPGLVATTPVPVTIDGLSGKQVDLSVAPTWNASCPYAYSPGLPLVSTFSSPGGNGVDWNVQGQGRTRIIILDLPNDRSLVIDIEGQNKADYDALLPDAMQVVNSFVLKP